MKPLFQSADKSKEEAVEAALLEAAERVLAKKGFESATMRDIAVEAGCSHGSLYLYFKTKDDLFDALADRRICLLLDLIKERMDAVSDPVEELRAGCLTTLEFFREHQGFFRIFFAGRTGRGGFELALGDVGRAAYENFIRYQIAIVEQAQKKGQIRTDISAPELIAFMHDVAIGSMARWTRSGDSAASGQQFDALWQFTSNGLGLPGPSKTP